MLLLLCDRGPCFAAETLCKDPAAVRGLAAACAPSLQLKAAPSLLLCATCHARQGAQHRWMLHPATAVYTATATAVTTVTTVHMCSTSYIMRPTTRNALPHRAEEARYAAAAQLTHLARRFGRQVTQRGWLRNKSTLMWPPELFYVAQALYHLQRSPMLDHRAGGCCLDAARATPCQMMLGLAK